MAARHPEGLAMRSAEAAFRASLVALAAAIAALLAHVTIDVAGDFLLAHDTYDGIQHQSRAVFVVAIAALAIAVAARVLFDVLDRRCGSTMSLLRLVRTKLGSPSAFVLQTAGLAIVTLVGMELLDCMESGTAVDDVTDLLGGSLALGLSATIASGAVVGWIVHRLVRLIADHEPAIAVLVFRLVRATPVVSVEATAIMRAHAPRAIVRSLLLARRGSKRGPPLLIPA